ncbi:hypothetical protein IHE45_02G043700 [Dioscorea alata]|uniref:Uncharacterized protein n=1 Tax=Dioscorea alata TaxID=55571 RepID=A0ACB7WPX0_DIOAL|nr:hypothetical protein IHE45_02G043700 [Dioscorea alata]
MAMKLLKTLVLLVLLMASAMAATEGMHEDKATIPDDDSFETSVAGIGTEAKLNGWPETGIHFNLPPPKIIKKP